MRPEIEKKFGSYRIATEKDVKAMGHLRNLFLELAHAIDRECPDCEEKTDALNLLLKSMMMANASIMIHEGNEGQ